MKQTLKSILMIALSAVSSSSAFAQQNASSNAQQAVNLALSNALEITFTDNNSSTGNSVNLLFDDVSDYVNGVESKEQELRVRSNIGFDVTVESSTGNFIYTGPEKTIPTMEVDKVLEVMVTENNTGGTVTGGFNKYQKITNKGKKMINKGDAGGKQTFKVQYRADPGFEFPAGTYTTDIIFTLTQH
ncbi:MAG TPA: hypothetical protein PL009_13290 [Flavipsychrobacter sp.]|nr:hypothetical protein [Flavipsychrobacter sp.]